MEQYIVSARKYRPSTFSSVVGQQALTSTLKNAIATDRLAHAYLFCGSRGVGKTSCARIFAKTINCTNRSSSGEACNECDSCRQFNENRSMNIIELDAASHNGVEDMKSLIDQVMVPPSTGRYRVFIIDEVHMLTSQAFNAFLKTLEEPPQYVVFILATTEFHKLPTTIVSRCQRFDFRRISSDTIVSRLFKISEAENIDLGEDGARLIARASRGGMRDAVSLLELCAGSKAHIDASLVATTLGTGDRESAYRLIGAIGKSDFSTVYEIINDTVMSSGDISVFWQEIIDSYRDIMVVRNTDRAKSYLDLTDGEFDRVREISKDFTMAKLIYHTSILEAALADMQRASNAKRSIAEIALTRMCDPRLLASAESLAVRVEELEKQVTMLRMGVSLAPAAQAQESAAPKIEDKSVNDDVSKSEEPKKKSITGTEVYASFGSVLERIAEIKKSLSSQFVGAKAYRTSENSFLIEMSSFFADKISSSPADMTILRGVIAEKEGKAPAEITVTVKSKSQTSQGGLASDLENI